MKATFLAYNETEAKLNLEWNHKWGGIFIEPFELEKMSEACTCPLLFRLKKWEQAKDLTAVFTSRLGGVSSQPYGTLNGAYHVGDNATAVLHNREKIAHKLKFSINDWTCAEQVHGNEVSVVHAHDRGKGCFDRQSAFQYTDGLVTNVRGILLTACYADCVPLYFYDPVKQAIGVAHAGWKGTTDQIAVRTIEVMEQQYGSARSDILAAIGPSIGKCCYEVENNVMRKLNLLFSERDYAHRLCFPASYFYRDCENGKWKVCLKQYNRHIMIKAGILPDHIECTLWCTSCRPDLFFSYRKQAGVTGRMVSCLGLRER